MSNFLKNLEIILNSGDPEMRTWFLIRHNYLPFILCGSYALFSTIIGPAIMKNRKPYNLRKIMIFFNFFLVATYTICLSIVFSPGINLAVLCIIYHHIGCCNLKGFKGFYYWPHISREEFCKGTYVKKGDIRYTVARAAWIIYLLKYIEFLDTVFFVLRKKQNQITLLHVGHHTVVPILGWIIARSERSGMQALTALINSIVHIIMYSYYGLSAMGPRVRKYLWWKKYLTQLQMIQFLLIILLVAVVAPLSGCTMLISSYIMDLIVAPAFLYLFYRFYMKSFYGNRSSLPKNEVGEINTHKNE